LKVDSKMRNIFTAVALILLSNSAISDVKPLPRSQWPSAVAEAVPHIIATLTVSQRSIVRGTSKESLQQLRGEWGEDIERLFGLNDGNTALLSAACGRLCPADEAAFVLMEAAWLALQK
jgi:hypothetical protein